MKNKYAQPRAQGYDKSAKGLLKEIAAHYGVDVGLLRAAVGRAGLQPQLIHYNPRRYYYSYREVHQLILKESRLASTHEVHSAA